jgi:hypothetical protein
MDEIKKIQDQRKNTDLGISLSSQGQFDTSIYGAADKNDKSQYFADLAEDEEEEDDNRLGSSSSNSFGANRRNVAMIEGGEEEEQNYREQSGSGLVNTRISDRESEVEKLI